MEAGPVLGGGANRALGPKVPITPRISGAWGAKLQQTKP